MSHLTHIAENKENLILRFKIIQWIREWFNANGFLEVETPIILRLPGQEPYLSPLKLNVHNESDKGFVGYLHTSPEYTLKKMLAAGFGDIYSLCKTFRDYESFGGTHNPEFTMIEWYRTGVDMFAIMNDVERLFAFIVEKFISVIPSEAEGSPSLSQLPGDFSTSLRSGRNDIAGGFERIHMRDLWKKFVGVNLDEYLTKEKMFGLCVSRGYKPEQSEEYEDLFSRIFIDEVEPYLGKEKPLIVHHYPMSMAALSRQSQADSGYAERFEVYIDGLELANAYCEITDADVIEERLKTEKIKRAELGRDVFEVDREFVEAVRCMPESAGISLGIDRLVQLFTGCKNIDDVLVLPMSELMNQ
ncbi:MAG: EF-P lysine aminoacylase EpmA [Patescibacteria group bacterium]